MNIPAVKFVLAFVGLIVVVLVMRTVCLKLALVVSPVVELKFITHSILNTATIRSNGVIPMSISRTSTGVESIILFKFSRKNVTTSSHAHSIEVPFTFRTLVIKETFIGFTVVGLIQSAVLFNKRSKAHWFIV